MSDSEKPKSWKERRQSIKHKWHVPFIFPEWLCERFSYFLGQWALLDICGHIGRFGVLISIIVGICFYVMEADERRMKAENERQQAVDQRKAKHYQAWQVINLAQGKSGNGGRVDALHDLHRDGISLVGVDVSHAFLPDLNLKNANLYVANLTEAILADANLTEAILVDANLTGANLNKANLTVATLNKANLAGATLMNADLDGANLDGANLFSADLTGAYLWRTNLANIKGWGDIKSIELANIYGVMNPPDGFIDWATSSEQGAVEIDDYNKWLEYKGKKRLEQTQEKQ